MPKPNLTREALHQAILPPNNCAVKKFLEVVTAEQREIVEEALGYDRKDLSAAGLRQLLLDSHYSEDMVPGTDAINCHRSGARPCRCKG